MEESGSQPQISMELEKEENIEFQRYSTSIRGINIKFYLALCGWELKTEQGTIPILDENQEYYNLNHDIDPNVRFCNEKCANAIINLMYGAISPTTQLSSMTENQIFDMWNFMDTINLMLVTNCYYQKNTFEIKEEDIDMIISFACEFYAYTLKCKDGFMVKKITETTASIYQAIQKANEPQPQSKGILGMFGFKRKV